MITKKMRTKARLLALLLAVLLVMLPLTSCKDKKPETPEKPNTDDEFTGSIAQPPANNGDGDENKPPLAEGDENATVQISSYDDLKNKIAQKGTFVLTNDIVIDAEDFTPIGTYVYPFVGTFDGNGHKITVTVKQSEAGIGFSPTFKFVYCGLFGVTRDASFKDLTVDIKASAVSTANYCFVLSGGIAAYMINTQVSGCTVNGQISAKSEFFNAYSGNIAGIIEGGEVKNCTANAAVSAIDSQNRAVAGGVAGYIIEGAKVEKCTVNGAVNAVSTNGIAYAGGLVGNARLSDFTACMVDADVNATVSQYAATDKIHGVAFAGGLIAVANGDSIDKKTSFTRCYVLEGTVSAVGNKNTAYAAGLSATVMYGSFVHCYSLCDVSASTAINLGFAASGFASIDSSLTQSSDKTSYVSEFIIDGCYVGGNVAVSHKDPSLMFLGTAYGYIISEQAVTANIKNLVYNSDATFTLNGKSTVLLAKNGTAKPASFFTLDNCVTSLNWSAEQWEITGGIISAK